MQSQGYLACQSWFYTQLICVTCSLSHPEEFPAVHLPFLTPLFLKVWPVNQQSHITWELLRNAESQASLVVQWLGIHLPMQGPQVRSLVQKDPTCHKAHASQLLSLCSRVREPQPQKPTSSRACARQQEQPLQREAHTLQGRGVPTQRN